MNLKRTTPRYIIIKMPEIKTKERILKVARDKQLVMYKGAPTRLSADFPTEKFQINNLTLWLKEVEYRKLTKPKGRIKMEIINIREEINKMES